MVDVKKMTRNIANRVSKVTVVAFLTLTLGAVSAQVPARASYPSKPITLVIPAAAGGGLDVSMRHIARYLSEALGAQVIVENRPSMNLLIGTRQVASAAPDGYTLLAISNTFIGAPVFAEGAGYDPFRDFVAIAPTAQAPNLFLVTTSSGITSVSDFIDRAKKPGANITFGTAGIGSSPHIAAALFAKASQIEFTDVPYKGAGPAMIDLIAGRITGLFDSVSSSMPHIKAGTLRALAGTTTKRSSIAPDTPTMAEILNQPDFDLPLFYGIAAPAKTPPDIVKILHAALTKTAADPALRERFAGIGFDTQSVESPADYTRFLQQQSEKFKRLKN
jgi:tripartite-type tricarboxylate transporter receptor subunit TctC